MATFQAQVEGLTSLGTLSGSTTPTLDELSQFLKDGVIDVTNKTLSTSPKDILDFTTVSSEATANDSLDINGSLIVSVVRESGTNNDWRDCKLIPPGMVGQVTDTDSLFYASKHNPVYTILDNGIVNVYPAPDTGGADSFKVYYVNNVPKDKSGAVLIYSHSDIKYFADDKVYLVVLYAAIKSIEAKIAFYAVEEEDTELVQAYQLNLQTLQNQYNSAFLQPKQRSKDEG